MSDRDGVTKDPGDGSLASTPIPPGFWIMASIAAGRLVGGGEPYPCLCVQPCRTRGERTCPCHGRLDNLDAMPERCCAKLANRATTWRTPAAVQPSGRRYAAPIAGADDEPVQVNRRFHAPAQPPAGRRYAAPRRGDRPVYAMPIRVREAWERQSRLPRDGEGDCLRCGELLAEHLVRQGVGLHVGC